MMVTNNQNPLVRLLRVCSLAMVVLVSHAASEQDQVDAAGECCAALKAIGFASNLPVVIIESISGTTIEYKVDQEVKLCTCSPPGSNITDYKGYAEAAGRGNSSKDFVKTQYKLELHDSNGEDVDFELLGFPEEEDFIAYGPELDRTLMKNYLAYNIGRGADTYASRTQFVEIFSIEDGSELSMDDYRGLFLMVEKQKRDKNRIDIEKMDDENPSGGYILTYDNDNYDWDEVVIGPFTQFGMDHPFVVKEPKELTDTQRDYLNKYLNDFMQSLTTDVTSGDYTSYIDMDSFINYLLAVEVTKNPDGYRGSTYLHKDRDGPLKMGPMWDYNEAFGMCCGYPIDGWQREGESMAGVAGGTAISPNGFRFLICEDAERCQADPTDGVSFWYRTMWKDPVFRNATSARWKELREGAWSDENIEDLVASARDQLDQGAVQRNYDTYADVLLEGVSVDGETFWKDETAKLEKWLMERLSWLDEALQTPRVSYAPTP